jgi:hypothetical protein
LQFLEFEFLFDFMLDLGRVSLFEFYGRFDLLSGEGVRIVVYFHVLRHYVKIRVLFSEFLIDFDINISDIVLVGILSEVVDLLNRRIHPSLSGIHRIFAVFSQGRVQGRVIHFLEDPTLLLLMVNIVLLG